MSKANTNFDHLIKDEYGDKKVEGTYYAINQLEKRIEDLENTIKEFMTKWGPEVQERRDRRDEVWDEMVRVVSIQKKNREPVEVKYDGDGNPLSTRNENLVKQYNRNRPVDEHIKNADEISK